ncbi:MAG: hypothetical protein JOZ38_12570 [Candidatus Eremiobacteraeota bacterium]|nr:hypothetical protein [Candidatus Eremiobacteraeota bacterium]
MLPYLLIVGIVLYLSLIGLALISLFTREIGVKMTLVSSSIGMGLILPIVLTLNRAGLPIGSFATAFCGISLAAAIAVLAWRRPSLPWRELRPFWPAAAIGAFMSGVPLLVYGFHWLANSNADFLIYELSAAGLAHDGFFNVPPVDQIVSGVNISQNVWFWEILPPNRYGTDAFVGLVGSALRMDPIYVYNSCSVSSVVMMVFAVGALRTGTEWDRRLPVISALLLAVASPLTLWSVYQQITPEIYGIVAMVALVALAQQKDANWRETLTRGVALGCVLSMFSFVYPEISPLFFLGCALCLPFAVWQNRTRVLLFLIEVAKPAAVAALTFAVLLNIQLFTLAASMNFLMTAAQSVSNNGVGPIFYYMVPSGFANFFGFVPFGFYPHDPWFSTAILAGMLCALGIALGALRGLYKGDLSSAMLALVFLLMGYLFWHRSGYVLFKVAFIAQPFLAPIVAAAILFLADRAQTRFRINPAYGVAAACVLIVSSQLYTNYIYLGTTSDALSNSTPAFAELHAASRDDLLGQIQAIADRYRSEDRGYLSDATITQLALIEGNALRGHSLEFSSLDPFVGLYHYAVTRVYKLGTIVGWPNGTRERARSEAILRNQIIGLTRINMNRLDSVVLHVEPYLAHDFAPPSSTEPARGIFVETGPKLSIFNNSEMKGDFDVRAVPWDQVRDHLSVVDSNMGHPPDYPSEVGKVAFGPLEPDPFDPGKSMAYFGRSMLLEVLNASPAVRLRLAMSASMNGERYTDLPSVTFVGDSTVKISNLGYGSARIVTPPMRPYEFSGHKYFLLKLGTRLVRFQVARSGLMRLFGNDIQLDDRLFSVFGRDLSVATDNLAPPHTLANFPSDLMNPALEYSGIYEDAWMGPRFSVRLSSEQPTDVLRLRFLLNAQAQDRILHIAVDGRTICNCIERHGSTRWVVYAFPEQQVGDHRITITTRAPHGIGPNDPRPAWARLDSIGFQQDVLQTLGLRLATPDLWQPAEFESDRPFRWIRPGATFTLPSASVSRWMYLSLGRGPSASGAVAATVFVGGKAYHYSVDQETDIRLKLPATRVPEPVRIEMIPGNQQIPNDARNLTLRVYSVALRDR